MLMLIRLIIMLKVSKPHWGLELVHVGIKNSRNVSYQPSLVIRSVANTSLAALGALAHRLQRRTACYIKNGQQRDPKWPNRSGKGGYWALHSTFAK